MVGVMSMAVPTTTTSTMIAISSRVWLSISGSSSSVTWPGRSAMVISQAETSEAATRNITTAVTLAAVRNTG